MGKAIQFEAESNQLGAGVISLIAIGKSGYDRLDGSGNNPTPPHREEMNSIVFRVDS
jgi:hypothetical protein